MYNTDIQVVGGEGACCSLDNTYTIFTAACALVFLYQSFSLCYTLSFKKCALWLYKNWIKLQTTWSNLIEVQQCSNDQNWENHTMRGFNFSICTWTRFCPLPSWHHLLFEIRFWCCVLFIRYWKIESRCPSVLVPTYYLQLPFIMYSWCIFVFIDNLQTRNDKYANLVCYISQQRERIRFAHLQFPYQ